VSPRAALAAVVALGGIALAWAATSVGGATAGDFGATRPPILAAASAAPLAAHPSSIRPPVDAPLPTAGGSDLGRAAASGLGLPACTYDDVPAGHAGYKEWATTLVDTAFDLSDDYRPPDLVPTTQAGLGGWGLVRSFVIDDLRALADAARAAGNPLAVQSAYRSYARQAEVFAGWVASSGERQARRFSARPGHSEHQLGTALDLRAASGGAPWSGSFGDTQAGHWLANHATEFGFVLSYPVGAEDRTCYGGEPWHIRYVGPDMAAEVAASGLTLREFLWQHDRAP